jgi:hypothetical protein
MRLKNFIICTFAKYYGGDEIKEDEFGKTCNTYE